MVKGPLWDDPISHHTSTTRYLISVMLYSRLGGRLEKLSDGTLESSCKWKSFQILVVYGKRWVVQKIECTQTVNNPRKIER